MMPCVIENCGKPTLARGWCSAHYTQWRKHGDPEAMVLEKRGTALAWLTAQVAHDGDDCLLWPFKPRTTKGYPVVTAPEGNTGAHRLMCALAHGEPPLGHEAAHSCGVRLCVNPRHLRWATRAENNADKRAHGTLNVGERNPAAKLSCEKVAAARALANEGVSHAAIAAQFGVSRRAIGFAVSGETWRAA